MMQSARGTWLTSGLVLAVISIAAHAGADPDPLQCRVVDLTFQPAFGADDRFPPQIVAWLEDPAGNFIDTVFITQSTGTFGLGNRPGRFDFNSAPLWPYGRRVTTFPVWSTKQPLRWPELVFQDNDDNDLSHSGAKSSHEYHFCRPLHNPEELDAVSCPSTMAYTDKGIMSSAMSRYPPREDLVKANQDSGDVLMFAMLNPFDAISQPTPAIGAMAQVGWAVPADLPLGDYVLFVEVSKEFDMNATYNETTYPAPTGLPWADYGAPYRGQPSVIYKVPFTMVSGVVTTGYTTSYIGYGDPDGIDGDIRSPDATISSDPGSGAGRLAMLSDGGTPFRVKVSSFFENDTIAPELTGVVNVVELASTHATLGFVAPGDDGTVGLVSSYEIRYRVGEPITEANFETSTVLTSPVTPVAPGEEQTVEIGGLLPETTYSIGIRALDNCRNASALVTTEVTTLARPIGEVDACFVATAAYGSVMAADVEMLRRFRDAMLRRSALGELAVEAYYTFGPAVAGLIGESDVLRATARGALSPIVSRVRDLEF